MLFLLLSFWSLKAMSATANISFIVPTSMSGVKVSGKAQDVVVTYNPTTPAGGKLLIDVFDLKTGMDTRDEHLREKVFAATKRDQVKIQFTLGLLDCTSSCVIHGELKIGEIAQTRVIPVSLSADKKSIDGETVVKLSDFKLNRPGFMGVKVVDEVTVNFSIKE